MACFKSYCSALYCVNNPRVHSPYCPTQVSRNVLGNVVEYKATPLCPDTPKDWFDDTKQCVKLRLIIARHTGVCYEMVTQNVPEVPFISENIKFQGFLSQDRRVACISIRGSAFLRDIETEFSQMISCLFSPEVKLELYNDIVWMDCTGNTRSSLLHHQRNRVLGSHFRHRRMFEEVPECTSSSSDAEYCNQHHITSFCAHHEVEKGTILLFGPPPYANDAVCSQYTNSTLSPKHKQYIKSLLYSPTIHGDKGTLKQHLDKMCSTMSSYFRCMKDYIVPSIQTDAHIMLSFREEPHFDFDRVFYVYDHLSTTSLTDLHRDETRWWSVVAESTKMLSHLTVLSYVMSQIAERELLDSTRSSTRNKKTKRSKKKGTNNTKSMPSTSENQKKSIDNNTRKYKAHGKKMRSLIRTLFPIEKNVCCVCFKSGDVMCTLKPCGHRVLCDGCYDIASEFKLVEVGCMAIKCPSCGISCTK